MAGMVRGPMSAYSDAMSDWELLYDGGQVQGPFSEAALIASIERGLPASIRVRPVGTADWMPIGAHPAFAAALARAARPVAPPPAPVPPQVIYVQGQQQEGGCSRLTGWACGVFVVLPIIMGLAAALAKGCV